MCYSALIESSIREISRRYGAHVDREAMAELFTAQEQGGGFKLAKGFGTIEDSELQAQHERLRGWACLEEPFRGPERIFPKVFAPLLVVTEGRLTILPCRYHLRPSGEKPEFDRKFSGTYNVRRDRLQEVRWWDRLYGRHHGVLIMKAFYEHVPAPGGGTRVLEFREDRDTDHFVPCLFDRNECGPNPFWSFGLITDEPNPEVLAAGHDRTPSILKPENLKAWLDTESVGPRSRFDRILQDRKPTRFSYRVAN
jgi:putative SOS response-associated peptidase YedK